MEHILVVVKMEMKHKTVVSCVIAVAIKNCICIKGDLGRQRFSFSMTNTTRNVCFFFSLLIYCRFRVRFHVNYTTATQRSTKNMVLVSNISPPVLCSLVSETENEPFMVC